MSKNSEIIGAQIKYYRKAAKKTQEDLADEMGVTPKSVQSWENGKFRVNTDIIIDIASYLKVPVGKLLSDTQYPVKTELFKNDNMLRFVEKKLSTGEFPMSSDALEYVKRTRKKDKRINSDVPYIYHPLLMVCQVFALGIADDELVAACLLHDALEVHGASRIDLPRSISNEVKDVCMLMIRQENAGEYFAKILDNPLACMVKCLSRCSNLATMNTVTDKKHRKRCIRETERYYGNMLAVIKQIPKWNNAAWLLGYQINSLCEAHKLVGL